MARFDFLSRMGQGTSPLKGRRWLRTLILSLGGFLGLSIAFSSLTEYIRPHEAGVKQSRYGGGISDKPFFGPGLFLTGPGVTYYTFPTVLQILNMNSGQAESVDAEDNTRNVPALEVDSSDGSKIRIDATLLYRVKDPIRVHTRIGPGRLFEDNAVIPKASQALRESLGALRAEDFYNEALRVRATSAAQTKLNVELKELGLSVDYVLIRQYSYLPDYQSQIEERKVQDQLLYTNRSMGEAAKMESIRKKLDAEGQAAVAVELQRGNALVANIRAEADLQARKKRADGDLLVALANAQGTELENNAYRAGQGADNLVGMEMADALDGVEVIFVQGGKDGTNLLDLGQVLNLFDVQGR